MSQKVKKVGKTNCTVCYSSCLLLIDDCSWPEVPNRTRNDRSQLVVDKQRRSAARWWNPWRNCIDSRVLGKLVLDCSSKLDKNIAPMLSSHWPDYSSFLFENGLARRSSLADEGPLARPDWKPRPPMARRNHTISDRRSSHFAIELD